MKYILLLCLLFPVTALADIDYTKTKYTEESVIYTIRYVFGPYGVADEMVAIAKCESGFENRVHIMDINNKPSKGIFQLNGGNIVEGWSIPYNNAQKALELYLNGGFRHWLNCMNKLSLSG